MVAGVGRREVELIYPPLSWEIYGLFYHLRPGFGLSEPLKQGPSVRLMMAVRFPVVPAWFAVGWR